MGRVVGVYGLLFAAVLTVGACGGDGGQESGDGGSVPETTQTTATPETTDRAQNAQTTTATRTAKTLPDEFRAPVSPGKYVTDEFEPAFSFRVVDKGWKSFGGELPDSLGILQEEDRSARFLEFDNPQEVYDPQKLPKQAAIPEPEDWAAWYQNHPYLETTKPEPVSVGGISGVRFTVEAASAPENYPEDVCGPDPCVSVFPLSDGTPVVHALGEPEQLTIVEVGAETVLIPIYGIGVSEEDLEAFFPVAQKVIDTVEWKAAP